MYWKEPPPPAERSVHWRPVQQGRLFEQVEYALPQELLPLVVGVGGGLVGGATGLVGGGLVGCATGGVGGATGGVGLVGGATGGVGGATGGGGLVGGATGLVGGVFVGGGADVQKGPIFI